MTVSAKDFLLSCRKAVLELHELDKQLLRCLPTGAPSGMKAQQYDADPPGTNEATAAAIQLYEGLVARREKLATKVASITNTAWRIISTLPVSTREMAILSDYYLLGMTDVQIALKQELSREYVCELRRKALLKLC